MNTRTLTPYFGTDDVRPMGTLTELIAVSRAGISKKAVATLLSRLGIGQPEMFTILHLSPRTWQRYSGGKLLPQDITERALKLAELYAQGEGVSGGIERFRGWMTHQSIALGGKRPLDVLDTLYGFQVIADEIIRIQYGVLA